MTGSRIPLHARNHLVGGSDPIPYVWLDATLESPWTESGDPLHPVQFSKNALGQLRFRGGATGGGAGDVMFYLPTAYWPEKDEPYLIARGTDAVVLLVLASNGSVTPLS